MKISNMIWFLRVLFATTLAFASAAGAEPWLATRYAQNCAACHTPGRINVEPPKRRCTLSCQGCHTNPNGGGLRNWYGKWNQERWLNSFYLPGYKMNRKRPAVVAQQKFGSEKLEDYLIAHSDGQDPKKKKIAKWAERGFELKETSLRLPESEYDRRTSGENIIEKDQDKVMLRIPQDDPLRQKAASNFMGGGDLRYFYLKQTGDRPLKTFFPMAADVGASAHPARSLNLVTEARFLNSPNREAWDEMYTSSSQVRSAYVMLDDLPYNTYVMYGLYRPMFGYFSPDHTSLFASATGLDQRAVYKALTVGAAPNVPFANFHIIMPQSRDSGEDSKGYAANLGLRFVTLGANIMFSYWNTSTENSAPQINKTMYSLTGGFIYGRWIAQGDYTYVKREIVGSRKDAGAVMTLENRYRLWEEFYAMANFELLNTAPDLTEGSSTQSTFGLTSFPLSSLQVDMVYRDRKVSVPANGTARSDQEKLTMAQIHWFY